MQYELRSIKCRRINNTATLSYSLSVSAKVSSLKEGFLGDKEDWMRSSAAERNIS